MQAILKKFILEECDKLICRHFDYLYFLDQDIQRKQARMGSSIKKKIHYPFYWDLDQKFNPFKVRSRVNTYGFTLTKKIRSREYEPQKAVVHFVPKADGSQRELNIFQLPDSAVSRLVYKSLLRKNYGRFSSYAYAYREDKIAYDAVRDIYAEWKGRGRLYVAEFDYGKFFDNIDHDYLWEVFDRHGFLATQEERFLVDRFLKSRCAPRTDYLLSNGRMRDKGIPQGTSISLFLANLACWELDKSLERLGVGFARYADDTLIWSQDYAQIVRAYELISSCGEKMGVPINFEKSEGIHLVSNSYKGEIKSKMSVDFLAHRISPTSVAIKKSHVSKIKRRISYLIYQNLCSPSKRASTTPLVWAKI
jgi:RNA-directed DNA polymerase